MSVTRKWNLEVENFDAAFDCDWSNENETRKVKIEPVDDQHVIITIERDTASECLDTLLGQISDGFFENNRTGSYEEIEIEKYVIVDDRELLDSHERESRPMTLEEVKKWLGSEYLECEDVYELNEKLENEKAGEAGYRVEEVK